VLQDFNPSSKHSMRETTRLVEDGHMLKVADKGCSCSLRVGACCVVVWRCLFYFLKALSGCDACCACDGIFIFSQYLDMVTEVRYTPLCL
jgi:hypothetical protein